jgi:hypothetical protein
MSGFPGSMQRGFIRVGFGFRRLLVSRVWTG